ncbi:MAG TPA: hypothetical protein VIU46_00840 [Gallionellaceae bacterium]
MVFEELGTGTWHAYGKLAASPPHKPRFDYNSFRYLYTLAQLKPIPVAGYSRFAGYLAIHFPEVASKIDEADYGVLHLEVGELRLATRSAILQRDWPTVRAHFEFADSILKTADVELHDAIGVSYLGSLFYSETSLNFAKARTLLPKRLAVALEIMERHYEELAR